MTTEEIAEKLCRHSYARLCAQEGAEQQHPLEKYREVNWKYFMGRAEIYLEVKAYLEAE